MNDERLNVLCNELRSLANIAPGVNPPCELRARAIAQEIQRSVDSKGIRDDAKDLTDGFQLWFSPRKWNQAGDEGRHLKSDIFASILKVEGAMNLIHRSRIKPTAAGRR